MSDDVIYNGRLLGTASGWDGELGSSIWFYDFKPAGDWLGEGTLEIDEENGYIGLQNDDGDREIMNKQDLPEFLVKLPRIKA